MHMKQFGLIFYFTFQSLLLAQDYSVLPIEFSHSGDDAIGTRLGYKINEEIRESKSMALTFDETIARMQLILVTLEPNSSNSYLTVYSATWVWNNPEQPLPFYITSMVGTCGTNRVNEVAEDLVAQTDKHLNDIRKIFVAAKNR